MDISNIEKVNFQPTTVNIVVKDGKKYLEEFSELGPLVIQETLSFKDKLFGFFRRHLWRQVRVKTKSGNSELEEDCFIDMTPLFELQEEVLDRTMRVQKSLNPFFPLPKKEGESIMTPKKEKALKSLFKKQMSDNKQVTKVFNISKMSKDHKENSNYLNSSLFRLKKQLQKLIEAENTPS